MNATSAQYAQHRQDAGPPKGVSASSLFLKLTQTPRPKKEIDYPRNGEDGLPIGKLWLVPITEKELMQCRASAESYAQQMLGGNGKPLGDSLGYQDIYRNAVLVEFVTRACKAIEDTDLRLPVFPSAQAVRDTLQPDEIAVLYEAAMYFQSECGPIVSSMTKDEMEGWIVRLAEGASSVPLARLSWEAKKDLILTMASSLRSSWTRNGSRGSLLGESSSPAASNESAPSEATMGLDEVPPAAVKD